MTSESGPSAGDEDIPATSTALYAPEALLFDGEGNLYMSQCPRVSPQRVVRIDPSGLLAVVAGTGDPRFPGDGGPATAAQLLCPAGLALDGNGNLYVADHGNNRVRRVDRQGVITTVAGGGAARTSQGSFSGDGGPAAQARLQEPIGIVFDAAGNLYIADRDNARIRKINLDGVITTVAGTGEAGFSGDGGSATSARLSSPYYLAFDADGNLYIADKGNNRIRKVDRSGVITTVAGGGKAGFLGDGGPATKADLRSPYGLALDPYGNLYISEQDGARIRELDQDGIITTIAGTGVSSFSGEGEGGPATSAELGVPQGIAFDREGNLYIADGFTDVVWKVDAAGVITTVAGSRS